MYIEGTKCNLNTYVYDIKSGKSKEIKFNYYIADVVEEFDDSVILKVCNIVDKQTTAPYVQSFGFDVVGNLTVKIDLQKMLKGANEASISIGVGGKPQLLLSNTTDVSLFEDKECIFTISKGVNAFVFLDMVMIDGKAYTLNGDIIIDEDVLDVDISFDGKLLYSKQDKDDVDKIRYYIYDIAKGSEREITVGAGESVTFRSDYYQVGKKVYFYALERQVIDNVQSINAIDNYWTSDGSNKTIYKVTTTDGSEKYYVFNQYYK
ncbi:MAG: hypothetical protein ACI4M5_03840 [Christensenellales bacterium]